MLSLVEEITLLALDDKSGAFLPTREYALEMATAGAVLLELALLDRIDTDMQELMVIDEQPTGDDILDPVLCELSRSSDSWTPRKWLLELARIPFIQAAALERLVARGILRRQDRKLLWVFESRRYPVLDGKEQKEVKQRVTEILFQEEIPDPRDVVLICLAQAVQLFPAILGPRRFRDACKRIEQVAKMDLLGRQMLDELRDLHDSIARTGWWEVGEPSPGLAARLAAGSGP